MTKSIEEIRFIILHTLYQQRIFHNNPYLSFDKIIEIGELQDVPVPLLKDELTHLHRPTALPGDERKLISHYGYWSHQDIPNVRISPNGIDAYERIINQTLDDCKVSLVNNAVRDFLQQSPSTPKQFITKLKDLLNNQPEVKNFLFQATSQIIGSIMKP